MFPSSQITNTISICLLYLTTAPTTTNIQFIRGKNHNKHTHTLIPNTVSILSKWNLVVCTDIFFFTPHTRNDVTFDKCVDRQILTMPFICHEQNQQSLENYLIVPVNRLNGGFSLAHFYIHILNSVVLCGLPCSLHSLFFLNFVDERA